MARTYHHSRRWGRDHPHNRPNGYYRMNSPGWWVHLCMNGPGRIDDRRVVRLIIQEKVDYESVTFERTGSHKPHNYYY